ncbi:hypothetical protein MS3_00002567 [Schistosoma haematobium]|uniref:FMRFamide-activated amiloride-sensitive sodium channel n=1 Tax=Schistosoma haematobium TaxID=6185 RepID=A0A922LU30_SCHHA|nr:hypothetical protein MS3_00002567 [Schistosoma haematobium]KAH9593920.1 hypothetical protein MS3_00002567 [Schistosoma haematobium]CAH8434646.1 unnamed protein product [Schistosoma haematobium]CAH8434684.1 unnamed protein product [Schistosoma haematobium]
MHKNKNVEKSVKCKQSNKCSNLKICHHHHRDQDQDQDQDHHHHHHHCGYCSPKYAFDLFCSCTSVRGMSKIRRGPKVLRIMWLTFVLSMTFLLLSSTALLIKDFLNYDVSVHTQLIMDNPSPFPSLTVCHQPPFSYEAYKLWNESKILSPSKYNLYMRKLILNALYKNDIQSASTIWSYDSLSVYYQNLNDKESLNLGHNLTIFLNCMRIYSHMSVFEDNCTLLNGYHIKRLSHHQYLNCYTFEPININAANETTFLSLIVGMGPRDKDINIQQAFLPDVFEQARGLRVVIHETGTMPDLEKNGIHVEPGKLNEINYEPIRWKKLNTPKRPCIKPNESHQYFDLNIKYNYTHTQCLLVHQQIEIMNHCHCIYVMHPRLILPSKTLPYCGQLWPYLNQTEFIKKILCLNKYLNNSIKQKYDGHMCFPRCEFYDYESTTSVTKWRAYPWQLYWLRVQNYATQSLIHYHNQYPSNNITYTNSFKLWEFYLNYNNLTNLPRKSELLKYNNNNNHNNTYSDIFTLLPNWPPEYLDLDSEDFAYVILKRKSHSTIEKTEKLILNLYVLISRIGGLCSLTIGLTAAFFVELFEFCYLLYKNNNIQLSLTSKTTRIIQTEKKCIPLNELKQMDEKHSCLQHNLNTPIEH